MFLGNLNITPVLSGGSKQKANYAVLYIYFGNIFFRSPNTPAETVPGTIFVQ